MTARKRGMDSLIEVYEFTKAAFELYFGVAAGAFGLTKNETHKNAAILYDIINNVFKSNNSIISN